MSSTTIFAFKEQVPSPRERKFKWPICHKAEKLVQEHIAAFLRRNSQANYLAQCLHQETGSLLMDWIDHLVITSAIEQTFRVIGYRDDIQANARSSLKALHHPEATLPRILVDHSLPDSSFPVGMALRVDSITDFMAIHEITHEPEGDPLSRYRRILVSEEENAQLEAVERRGYRGYVPASGHPSHLDAYLHAQEIWKTRRRRYLDSRKGFIETEKKLDRLISLVGRNQACHIIFTEERAYWQRRNLAARVQKDRQDRLGMGWANQDHHSFRSSRYNFLYLTKLLEKLGFERRERFYAGEEAGWGAQVWEHAVEDITLFCNVDLLPEEKTIDFSREALAPSKKLGAIGLWVELHGESLLQAGMHHLECRFDFKAIQEQLASEKIRFMPPFSNFSHLRQAFTVGESWPVEPVRVTRLLNDKRITRKQADIFLHEGVIGSHLEILQRKGGYKGINLESVSATITQTDPRIKPVSPA
jgi:hypothetical protein